MSTSKQHHTDDWDIPGAIAAIAVLALVALAAFLAKLAIDGQPSAIAAAVVLTLAGCALVFRDDARPSSAHRSGTAAAPTPPPNPAGQLRSRAVKAGGGFYIARSGSRYIWAPPQAAGLILAGPRAGKTSCIVIPALLAHPGALVSTSTKPEVMHATIKVRQEIGTAWCFDLGGRGVPGGATQLRWSPLTRSADWVGAQVVAEAMTGATDFDRGSSHWTERASALIASCFYAAATAGLSVGEVQGWILRHDIAAPLAELPSGSLAHDVLYGLSQTADRERSGIFSTAARVLRAYRNPVALANAESPNFSPEQFASSTDTVYIAAPAHQQALLAPLVVGLLSDIRHAIYERHWDSPERPPAPILFMLDECANIAPLPDLPALLSEAGGQGLQTVCVFQDMSQVRRRWPREADGFMSLFGAKAILAGIADPATLEQLSLICGERERPVVTVSRRPPATRTRTPRRLPNPTIPPSPYPHGESVSMRRERQMHADEIARLEQGKALVMVGPEWEVVRTVPWDRDAVFAGLARGGGVGQREPA